MARYNENAWSEQEKRMAQYNQRLYQLFTYLTLHLQKRCVRALQEFES